MFDSGVTGQALITLIASEIEVAANIPQDTFINWLNTLEQLLYSEVIKEIDVVVTEGPSPIQLSGLTEGKDNQNALRFEDIRAVYAGNTDLESGVNVFSGTVNQLTHTTPISAGIFNNVYWRVGNELHYKTSAGNRITICYFVRPMLKNTDNISNTNVMIPYEFLSLVYAKLRGEAYKLVNEDAVGAKWLNDYNSLLEAFKTWVASRDPKFGV